MHPNLQSERAPAGPSERSFGITFAILFAAIGLAPLARHHSIRGWAVIISAALLAVSLLKPSLLHTANRAWMGLAAGLNKIASPILAAMVFFLVILPTGLLLRMLGKDPLRRRFDPQAKSYWLPREPPGPDRESMSRQF